MVIEMLAIKIRSNNIIKWLEFHGLKTMVLCYADNSCFLKNPQFGSLHSLIEDLDTLSNLSGLQPNDDECTILRVGSQLLHHRVIYLTVSDVEVDILSIHIPKARNDLTRTHFYRKLA